MTIGQQIRRFREQKGMKQHDLATVMGVRENVISMWENGRIPRTDVIPELAKALGVTPNDLLSFEDPETAQASIAAND